MKYFISLILLSIILVLSSCVDEKPKVQTNFMNPEDWGARLAPTPLIDSLVAGKTYLSVYSQIYSLTEDRVHNLTATISLRNTDEADSVYITKAEYFDTEGKSIRTYFEKPIYLKPLETIQIVIAQNDIAGGPGGNFIFEWKTKPDGASPIFDGVMISTYGQQGLSFTTEGVRIE